MPKYEATVLVTVEARNETLARILVEDRISSTPDIKGYHIEGDLELIED